MPASPQTFAPQKGPGLPRLRPRHHGRASRPQALLEAQRGSIPALIEDPDHGFVAYPEGPQGSNIARNRGCSWRDCRLEVGGMTVNRFCGSSMSVIQICRGLRSRPAIGEGVSLRRRGIDEHGSRRGGFNRSPNPELLGRFPDAYISMGQNRGET